MKAKMGAFVPLVFGAGEAFQFDWSEDFVVRGGKQTKSQVAHDPVVTQPRFYRKGLPTPDPRDIIRRLWQPMPNFPDIDALNDWLEDRCIKQWTLIPHGGLPGSVADVHEAEVASLMPMGRAFDGFVDYTQR